MQQNEMKNFSQKHLDEINRYEKLLKKIDGVLGREEYVDKMDRLRLKRLHTKTSSHLKQSKFNFYCALKGETVTAVALPNGYDKIPTNEKEQFEKFLKNAKSQNEFTK